MPSVSEAQRKLACLALSIKLGKTPKGYSPEAAKMAKEMSIEELSDFCKQPVREK